MKVSVIKLDFVSLFSQENFIFVVGVGAFGCLIYQALLNFINLSTEKLTDFFISNRLKRAEVKNVELQNILLSAELEKESVLDA